MPNIHVIARIFSPIVLVILVTILVSLSGFYADLLWFRSVDFVSVWSTVLTTKIYLFIFFGLITSIFITTNIYIAFRSRPIYAPISIEADNLERYRGQLEPIRRWVLIAIAVGLFYFAGSSGKAAFFCDRIEHEEGIRGQNISGRRHKHLIDQII